MSTYDLPHNYGLQVKKRFMDESGSCHGNKTSRIENSFDTTLLSSSHLYTNKGDAVTTLIPTDNYNNDYLASTGIINKLT
jgi:hypothetical protein